MIKLSRSDDFVPNTWRQWIDRDFKNKVDVTTACVTCPNCGNAMSLKEHTIAENGIVSPSLICPTENCSFHEFVHLEDWE